MSEFRLIPVIDLKNGQVVHGKKGQRNQYQPIVSKIVSSSNPVDVAKAFWDLGLKELYIADIDALQGKGDNLSVINDVLAKQRNQILLDIGITSLSQLNSLIDLNIPKIILALETLPSEGLVQKAIEIAGNKIVMSLDMRDEKILVKCESLKGLDLINIASIFYEIGVSEMIVLDLASVGSSEGVPFETAFELKKELDITVLAGGGVRNLEDLILLQELELDGCLVATALHKGTIGKEEIELLASKKTVNKKTG
ncbi:MAG: HisA/HisF-related TIM barrel protein [Candidatus Hermodarchaeota archaeon]